MLFLVEHLVEDLVGRMCFALRVYRAIYVVFFKSAVRGRRQKDPKLHAVLYGFMQLSAAPHFSLLLNTGLT